MLFFKNKIFILRQEIKEKETKYSCVVECGASKCSRSWCTNGIKWLDGKEKVVWNGDYAPAAEDCTPFILIFTYNKKNALK